LIVAFISVGYWFYFYYVLCTIHRNKVKVK